MLKTMLARLGLKDNSGASQSSAPAEGPISREEKIRRFIREAVVTGGLILVVLSFRSSIGSHYKVPTGSMIPTILPGDRFFSSQIAYGLRVPFSSFYANGPEAPTRGDIIVFPSPVDSIDLVKRVVAIAGDNLVVRDGRFILNGKELDYEYVGKSWDGSDVYIEDLMGVKHFVQFDQLSPGIRSFEISIPKGHFFPMGDNRDHSADGRYFGPVPYTALRGRAGNLFYSVKDSFIDLRWSRSFNDLYRLPENPAAVLDFR
jgi:signal peptidase I